MTIDFAIPGDSWPDYHPSDPSDPSDPPDSEDAFAEAIDWSLSGALSGTVRRGDYRVGVFIQAVLGDWQAIGLVSPLEREGGSVNENVEAVLASHAHQNLGTFSSLESARTAALSFLRTAPLPSEKCPCEPVEPPLEGLPGSPLSLALELSQHSHREPLRCVECGGEFFLGYGPCKIPMVLHSLPHCAGFDALESTAEAVSFSQRCRAAAGDHRR